MQNENEENVVEEPVLENPTTELTEEEKALQEQIDRFKAAGLEDSVKYRYIDEADWASLCEVTFACDDEEGFDLDVTENPFAEMLNPSIHKTKKEYVKTQPVEVNLSDFRANVLPNAERVEYYLTNSCRLGGFAQPTIDVSDDKLLTKDRKAMFVLSQKIDKLFDAMNFLTMKERSAAWLNIRGMMSDGLFVFIGNIQLPIRAPLFQENIKEEFYEQYSNAIEYLSASNFVEGKEEWTPILITPYGNVRVHSADKVIPYFIVP